MKKLLFILTLVCLLSIGLAYPCNSQDRNPSQPRLKSEKKPEVKEQADIKEAPPSRRHKQIKVDESVTYRLPPLNPQMTPQGKGRPLQIGVTRPLSLDPRNKSKWFNLQRGGQVGVFGIISKSALQLRVHFTEVALPRGAKIFISSMKNPDEFYGPFEGRGPNGDGSFWTPLVEGEGVIIEYFVPGPSSPPKNGPSPFIISEVSHIFRD